MEGGTGTPTFSTRSSCSPAGWRTGRRSHPSSPTQKRMRRWRATRQGDASSKGDALSVSSRQTEQRSSIQEKGEVAVAPPVLFSGVRWFMRCRHMGAPATRWGSAVQLTLLSRLKCDGLHLCIHGMNAT
ncbi:hypothetical protein Taro_056342 [Colocasia esculenta]|uniref:Uncharacterized protein n=1 Tax=Colocasia esculenta TaxID=4460 RepID=A0A843XT96_COLES|nr:hypothetical protein [Colocasia esculenta]